MGKKEYKSQLIMARVPYSLFIVFKSELYRAKNQLSYTFDTEKTEQPNPLFDLYLSFEILSLKNQA
jgi:hypothetical protein